jgi:hypothetical protein
MSHTHATDLFVVTSPRKDVGSTVVQYGTVFVLDRIKVFKNPPCDKSLLIQGPAEKPDGF